MVKTLAIIAVGVFLQLSAVWFLGKSYNGGLFFCCRGVPDDIYHLALANELVNRFPPHEPGMAGVVVKNYHYLSSLVMADFIRVFHLPLIPTVYQYFPVFISVLLGLTILVLAQLLNLNTKITRLWLLFLYFHGDILYLLLALRGKGLDFGVTIFDDATKFLAGPPRSFSILLLFTGIGLFLVWIKKQSFLAGILTAIVLGSLIGFKVYTGIFVLIGLAATTIIVRKGFVISLIAFLVGLAIYLPVNGANGGLFWNGFYRFDNFISQPAFGLTNLELMRLAGANYLIILFIAAYFIFLYGPTFLAIFQTRKTLSFLPKELNIFLLMAIIITGTIGTFFVQNIGGLNTVQFLITLYFVAALYAALTVSRLPSVLIFIVVLLTLLRPLHEGLENIIMITNRQGFFISSQELEGLKFLKSNTPNNTVIALPPELARKEISLYVRFLTNRPLYLAGYTGVLEDHQVPGAKDRLEKPDFSKIDYFYLPKQYPFFVPGQTVFENQEVKIIMIPKIINKSAKM